MHADLLDSFRKLPRKSHPWWWPAGAGTSLEDWGLGEGDLRDRKLDPSDVLDSLQNGTESPGRKVHAQFEGFLGSVGHPGKDSTWVLTIRPSRSRFQQAGTARLYRLLREVGLLGTTRVTDILKFRGAAPSGKAWESADDAMRSASLEVLLDEYRRFPPTRVMVSGGATQRAFKALLRRQVKEAPGDPATAMLDDLYSKAHPTYFYSAQGMTHDAVRVGWERVLRAETPMHTPRWLVKFRAVTPAIRTCGPTRADWRLC
jgi:hypothetical protein